MNAKGGMNNKFFKRYMREIYKLYPDAAAVPGKQLLAKSDIGPGRNDQDTLCEGRINGCYHYPGLPNGTEIGQEMDQLFGNFKTLAYKNRDKIFQKRMSFEGENAPLSMSDVGYCVFGGQLVMNDGSVLVLDDAFNVAFTPTLIEKACQKCGYAPATRNALLSKKVCHKVVMTEDGHIDLEADPYGKLLEELEKQNTDACRALVSADYKKATVLERKIRRISAKQVRGRNETRTLVNTRERQELLEGVATAGQFFRVTNGGGPMNSNDVLIAQARKQMTKDADKLQKQKERLTEYVALEVNAKTVIESQNGPNKWKVPELQTMLKWKMGLNATKDEKELVKLRKPILVQMWNKTYDAKDAPAVAFSDNEEQLLLKLRAGKVELLLETTCMKRAFDNENQYLEAKLLTISCNRLQDVLQGVFENLLSEKAASLLLLLHNIEVMDDL